MVDPPAQQTPLDEVDGLQAQVADRSRPGLGRALDAQRGLRVPPAAALKRSGCECSRRVEGGGIGAPGRSVSQLPPRVLAHLEFELLEAA